MNRKSTTVLGVMVALALSAAILSAGQSMAQESTSDNTPAPKIRVLPPAYDAEMMRLAEILGALHYLRELCGAQEGQMWREQMQQLIKFEEPTPERRARMVAEFNHGFRGFRETYRECTPAALEANQRYIAEGSKIALEIPSRFGR